LGTCNAPGILATTAALDAVLVDVDESVRATTDENVVRLEVRQRVELDSLVGSAALLDLVVLVGESVEA